MQELTLDDIRLARERIASTARRTPFEHSRWLSDEHGKNVFLKLEGVPELESFAKENEEEPARETGSSHGWDLFSSFSK